MESQLHAGENTSVNLYIERMNCIKVEKIKGCSPIFKN